MRGANTRRCPIHDRYRNSYVRAYIVLAIVLAVSSMFSQTHENTFRLAQSYEHGGNIEQAITLYQQLHRSEPENYMFFDALRRCYVHLKKYAEAEALIRDRLASASNDVNLLCLLASVLYQAGNEKEAHAAWDNAIAVDPNNVNVYRLVANSLLENRLLEKTAELYRRARKRIGDDNLFTLDLAQLLGVMMDYRGATIEFLRYLAPMPTQLGYIQTRLSQFTAKPEARAAAIEALRSASVRPDELTTLRLLSWLLMEGKNYEEAFAVYRKIDKLASAQGVELYSFADRAYKEGAFSVAVEAYKASAEFLPADRLPYAKFGYALATKELTTLADTAISSPPHRGVIPEARSRYATAVDYFRKVIDEYPNTELAAKAWYHIGMITFEKYFDLDGAFSAFVNVERTLGKPSSISFTVSIKLGEVLTAKGDTAAAAQRYRSVIAAPNATPDQQDEATYRLAELEYFGGNFKESMRLLDNISTNLKADYTNDALLLLTFLQESISPASGVSEVHLREFATADFLARQQKFTEAITTFRNLITKNPHALFVDDALMRIAALHTRAGFYNDALASYKELLEKFETRSIALDKAQFSIARLYDLYLKDTQNAIIAYEKLLATYPQSLLVDAARKRIRELRGDSL